MVKMKAAGCFASDGESQQAANGECLEHRAETRDEGQGVL